MKPETSKKEEVEPERSGARESEAEQSEKEEFPAIEMTDDEKAVMNILKGNSPIDLNELKGQTSLSNKKWDKAIKGLTKNKLARVEKTDSGLLVSLA